MLEKRDWFMITDDRMRRRSFTSVKQLEKAIHDYIEHHNENPMPFIWTATPDKIFDKLSESFS